MPQHDVPPEPVAAVLLRALADGTDIVGVTDDAGGVVWLNAAGRRRLGVGPEERLSTADLFGAEVFERYYQEIRPALLAQGRWTGVVPVRSRSGQESPFEAMVVAELGPGAEVVALTTVAREIDPTASSRGTEEDHLTGLASRALLHDRLDLALRRSRRAGGMVAVVFADVDRLKAVNDVLGHAAGDTLLREVAARLASAVRPSDTVARLGGDEFVVVCDPVAGPDDARQLAERLRAAVTDGLVVHDGAAIAVSASFGVAIGVDGSLSASELLRRADAAMYRAKSRGTRLEMASPRDEPRPHDEVVHELSVALSQRRITGGYQPIVRLADGVVTSWRTFPHWMREGVAVPEHTFLPHVERTAVALALDLTVLRSAVRDVLLLDDGAAPAALVPVTARTLSEPFLPGLLAEVLEAGGAGSIGVTLLVPAAAATARSIGGGDALVGVRNVGVGLAAHVLVPAAVPLRELAQAGIDTLVIEPEVVRSVTGDPLARRAVAAAVGLAAGLGAQVLADGVNDHVEEAVLAELGVTHVTGDRYGPVRVTTG
jgi:diguanylate cyclase (GGDEF)-like protein